MHPSCSLASLLCVTLGFKCLPPVWKATCQPNGTHIPSQYHFGDLGLAVGGGTAFFLAPSDACTQCWWCVLLYTLKHSHLADLLHSLLARHVVELQLLHLRFCRLRKPKNWGGGGIVRDQNLQNERFGTILQQLVSMSLVKKLRNLQNSGMV